MEKMDFNKFKEKIESLEVVYSIRDKVPYTIYSVDDKIVRIKRESTGSKEKLKMEELYRFYIKEDYYDTKIAKDKKYISGRVQSPAVAVLRALTENMK